MSIRFFEDDVMFVQRLLKCSGFYTGKIDGIWGRKTDAAMDAFEARSLEIAEAVGRLDNRSEKSIASLHPKAQEAGRVFIKKVTESGIDARIISGTRSYEEQNKLFRVGRFGDDRPRITNSRGGQSNHNFGIAWDVGIFRNGKYLTESPLYKKAAEIGLADRLEWGGNWRRFVDRPHYQLVTGLPLRSVRERFESGQAFV